MKNILSTLSFLFIITLSFSQALPPVNLCLGDDATVCQGQTVTITNCGGAGGIGGGGVNLNAPTTLSLSDDNYSGVVNIGFTFNFYGNNYSQCVISSNGYVSFNLANANGYSAWSLNGTPLPNTSLTSAYNTAMLCYQDMNPAAGGSVKYQTVGSAPNRIFVVLYENVAMFSPPSECNYMALLLFEGSNHIEFHIGNKPVGPSWNSGLAIQGTENNTGSVAHITPGRNNTQWTVNQDAKKFTPTSPINTTAYTITTIPYATIISPSGAYQWQNTLNQTFPYNNGVLNVNTVPPGTTGYFIAGSACSASVGGVSDTTWITRVSSSVTATSTPDICSSGIGTVTANPGNGVAPFTFNWPTLGSTNQTVTGVNGGTYTVQMVDANGCPSSANVIVGDTPASFSGSSTLITCPGGTDGTATATMSPVLGNISYQWDDPLMQTTQTATNLAAGTYNCSVTSDIGCTGIVTVTVSEIPGMIATISNQTDVTCNSGNDGMIEITVSQGTAGYAYSWDNSASISNSANDLYVGAHTVTITDANACVVTVSGTLGEPAALAITSITPDTQICPEDDIQLDVTGSGGSSAYLFTWSENGVVIGTGTSITVDPDFTNTQYCVVLTEACGSPSTQECNEIVFPTPINPDITPNKLEDCTPSLFEFINSSTNGSEIASTFFEFSDGNKYLEQGADSTSNLFIIPNFYSVDMTVTSIYGCVYFKSFPNLIEVKPLPIADFTFSSNPATFFETSIQLQDRSSVDVIDWDWTSPGSTPSYSQSTNPVFTFPEGEVGNYPVTLVVTTEHGCSDTATIIMHIVQDIIFYAPNSFTPDGDEKNQSWRIYVEGIDIYNFDLFIFNRWGEIIWESHDPKATWDGTYNGQIVPNGTYIWKASAKDGLNDGKHEFSGYINVLR